MTLAAGEREKIERIVLTWFKIEDMMAGKKVTYDDLRGMAREAYEAGVKHEQEVRR